MSSLFIDLNSIVDISNNTIDNTTTTSTTSLLTDTGNTLFVDTTGNNISISINTAKTYNFVSFTIQSVNIVLFQSATIYILLNTDNNESIAKCIQLNDQAYFDWGSDDNYLLSYIQTNIQAIFNS